MRAAPRRVPTGVFAALVLVFLFACSSVLAQDPFGSADPFEGQFKVRPNFQVRFRPPTKGGEVRLYTKKPVHYEKDVSWDGSDEVVIEYQDVKIRADAAHYDFPTRTATLEGHVIIDQGPTRLSGKRGTFQLEAKTGRMEDATADLSPAYHVIAQSIEKIGDATYRIHDGLFTACDIPKPSWSFRMAEAIVTLDDYARLKNVSFRAGSVPLLWTPYLIWPTKEDRASGMLVPGAGYSSRGAYLGLTHYWVTGRSTDLTSNLDLYSKGSVGVGEEFRWTPSPESAGLFQGYGIHDTDATVCVPIDQAPGKTGFCTLPDGTTGVFTRRTKNRWKYRVDHVSDDLPGGFRGVLALRDYSDPEYLQDLERSFALNSARQILSRAFLSKNFGDDSLNIRFERAETFFGTTIVSERLPSAEFFRRTSRVGNTPLFFSLESSASWLYLNRGPGLPRGDYGRFDIHPTLSLPWKRIPWLSITARGGGRFTEYTDSTDAATQSRFVGQSLHREYGEAGLSIVGPSFSRIFDVSIGRFGKFKHVIEPRIDYTFVSEVGDPERIPSFDEVDLQLGQNQVRYALVNRLLARAADPKAPAAEEVASFELAQTRAFTLPQSPIPSATTFANPLISRTGPVEATLRVAPGPGFHLDGRLSYDAGASQVTGTSVSAAYSLKTSFINATWFASRPILAAPLPAGSPSPNSDQFRLAAGIELSKWFRVDTQLNYDARQNLLLEDRTLVAYRASCYTVFIELRQLRLPPSTRRDIRFVVNLKDIGTLLDLHQSVDRIFGP